MLAAMVEVCSERGAANVTVAQVVARSGVSRRTFYELFEGVEECFLAALDEAVERVAVTVAPAYAQPVRWRERIRGGLAALLEFLEDEPELGALMVVGGLGAGPRALERRAEVLAVLIEAVDEGRDEGRADGQAPTRLRAEGTVGAVFAVLHARLLERDGQPLTELLNPLMAMVVLPYLGAAAARRELARPAPGRTSNRSPRLRGDPLKGLDMRLTYRTVRVLLAIGEDPGASNRQVARRSDVGDQGQMSKLLMRLQSLGLIGNTGNGATRGEPNAWTLTDRGREVRQAIQAQTGR
jgi:AcrR family transcriptional regulator/DNA-binding MarR family transcriptional regulator